MAESMEERRAREELETEMMMKARRFSLDRMQWYCVGLAIAFFLLAMFFSYIIVI